MATITAPTLIAPVITAYQAQAQAGGFLNDCLPDRFCAGRPQFDAEDRVWRVPVLLSYAIIGPVGQVGEVLVSAIAAEVVSATPKDEMMAAAVALYDQYRETIEAPVS